MPTQRSGSPYDSGARHPPDHHLTATRDPAKRYAEIKSGPPELHPTVHAISPNHYTADRRRRPLPRYTAVAAVAGPSPTRDTVAKTQSVIGTCSTECGERDSELHTRGRATMIRAHGAGRNHGGLRPRREIPVATQVSTPDCTLAHD
jgi:hypothetical protein